MLTARSKRIGLSLLFLVGLLSLSIMGVSSQEETATPLIIGFYGEESHSGARGLQVAVNEINQLGTIQGADGGQYRFISLVTQDLTLLSNALVVFVAPTAPTPETSTELPMPIFLLSPSGELARENMEGTFFRAVTAETVQYAALGDYLKNVVPSTVLVGDSPEAQAAFGAFSSTYTGEIRVFTADLPSENQFAEMLSAGAIAYHGSAENAGAILAVLESNGWTGTFIYRSATEATQAGLLIPSETIGVMGMTSWLPSFKGDLAEAFRQTYITETGNLPNAEAVSVYDVTWAIRLMVERLGVDPASLAIQLPEQTAITTQGEMNPAAYGGSELFQSVHLYQLQALGGGQVVANYDAGVNLSGIESIANLPTPTPQPTSTPSQAVVISGTNGLNIRTGPSEQYSRIGGLRAGEQAVILGALPDYSWYYVQAAALGWVKAEFVTIFNPAGGLTGIPIIAPPPAPTQGPTVTPSAPPDLLITSVELVPPRPIRGQAFTVIVNIQNNSSTPSGSFSVGGTWLPDNTPASVTVPSLDPFGTISAVLPVTLNQTGTASVPVTVDNTNQVTESNESNNTFNVPYVVDAQPSVEANNFYAVGQLNFAGQFTDIDWTGTQLNVLNGATLGVILGYSYEQVNVSQLKATAITGNTVGTIAAGTVFGMRTGQGHCGVFRIESVVGANITFTFRMYEIADCS